MSKIEYKKRYSRVSELSSSAFKKVKNKEVFVKGASFGFHTADPYISTRLNYSTGIYSYFGQGKTQILIQQLVHLSKTYGWKHAVLLTENGKKDELISDIIQTYMGINFQHPYRPVDDSEILDAYVWADEFFFIIDHEVKMLNIRDVYEVVADIEREEQVKINTVSIDNATNLAREQSKNSLMIHEYMNYLMSAINRTSMVKGYHTFCLFHVGKPEKFIEYEGKKYLPPPSVFNVVGGQMTNYLGYNLYGIYRPVKTDDKVGLINERTGVPYATNEVDIIVEKSKPKGVGSEGTFSLFFSTERQQYYEKVDGKIYYAGEYENRHNTSETTKPSAITPNYSFDTEDDIF